MIIISMIDKIIRDKSGKLITLLIRNCKGKIRTIFKDAKGRYRVENSNFDFYIKNIVDKKINFLI